MTLTRRNLLFGLLSQRPDMTTPYERTVLMEFQEEAYEHGEAQTGRGYRLTMRFYGYVQKALQTAAERHGKPCK